MQQPEQEESNFLKEIIDLDKAGDFEDLRMSIGPQHKSVLDQVTQERD